MRHSGVQMSDFGKGCAYCLGLFLAHEARILQDLQMFESTAEVMKNKYPDYNVKEQASSMWFHSACDHLFGLVIPDKYNPELKLKIETFKDRCLSLRLPMGLEPTATIDDYNWAINEAKELLLLIDKEQGIECEKGEYQ